MMPEVIEKNVPSRDFAISLTRGELRSAAETIPPGLAAMSESELFELRKPTENDHFLRDNLWKQVALAQAGGWEDITTASIYKGVCTSQNFDLIMKNPTRLAWIFTFPTDHKLRQAAALSMGLTRLYEFVSKPITDDNAGAFMKALEYLTNRVHGPLVQKNLNLNVNRDEKKGGESEPKNHVQLQKKIEELQSQLNPAREIIDVKAT